ncbi:MAG TPA: M48 family metalloprotease [Flavitalea sp.]|nr:M48 family metalloprotease [Flavitalea sp.]
MKKIVRFAILPLCLLLADSCSVNPVTGKKQMVFMSEAQEIALGQESDPQILAQYGLYEDSALQAFITEKGKQMAAISHRPNLPYEFRVVDSDILNAFAVPGGYVYFTRGIMAHFNNEAEFAGVLGHEIGHITARHSVIQQRNAMLGQLGLIAGLVIAPDLAQFAESASQGLSLLFLKFGRDDESQSDQLGVEYSSKIGYDAKEMAGFFKTLQRSAAQVGGEELPDFLSTHPNPLNRYEAVSKGAVEWQQKLNLNPAKLQVNRNSYLKRIEGLLYGQDPNQGYVENNSFYHPILKFQFPLPAGWYFQNTPQRVQMAPQDGKAMMMLTLAPGKTLEESANAVLQQYSLKVLDSKKTTVNGLPALAMLADQQQDQQQQQQQAVLRTLSYLISHGGNIYHLIGVAATADFNQYTPYFNNTMLKFSQLTDPSKLNRKPDRVRIKTVSGSPTLRQALQTYRVPEAKMEEMAILNGLELDHKLSPGDLIKVVEK